MADLGSIEPELDEEGDIVPPDRGGLPSDSKLLRAVRRLNHPDTTPEQREKYIRWMRKATRARLREMGALVQETPQFAVGEWIASRIGSRAGVPRTVAVCVMVHGTHVVGWETAGPDADGAVQFTEIVRTSGEHWVKASSIDPAVVAAAQAQGLV